MENEIRSLRAMLARREGGRGRRFAPEVRRQITAVGRGPRAEGKSWFKIGREIGAVRDTGKSLRACAAACTDGCKPTILDALRDLSTTPSPSSSSSTPRSPRPDGGLVGLPPEVWVADHLAVAMRDLQLLLLRYREAATDDARHRARLPITQMPLPLHPR